VATNYIGGDQQLVGPSGGRVAEGKRKKAKGKRFRAARSSQQFDGEKRRCGIWD
jgi:hypothetical protein